MYNDNQKARTSIVCATVTIKSLNEEISLVNSLGEPITVYVNQWGTGDKQGYTIPPRYDSNGTLSVSRRLGINNDMPDITPAVTTHKLEEFLTLKQFRLGTLKVLGVPACGVIIVIGEPDPALTVTDIFDVAMGDAGVLLTSAKGDLEKMFYCEDRRLRVKFCPDVLERTIYDRRPHTVKMFNDIEELNRWRYVVWGRRDVESFKAVDTSANTYNVAGAMADEIKLQTEATKLQTAEVVKETKEVSAAASIIGDSLGLAKRL